MIPNSVFFFFTHFQNLLTLFFFLQKTFNSLTSTYKIYFAFASNAPPLDKAFYLWKEKVV